MRLFRDPHGVLAVELPNHPNHFAVLGKDGFTEGLYTADAVTKWGWTELVVVEPATASQKAAHDA
jgi:hypothetical protein